MPAAKGSARTPLGPIIMRITLQPIKKAVDMFNSHKYPLHEQIKLLKKVQGGKGNMSAIKTIALPYMSYLFKMGKR
jgi:hypothetical protein